MRQRHIFILVSAVSAGLSALLSNGGAPVALGQPKPQATTAITIEPEKVLKLAYERGLYDKAVQLGYALLWKDMYQPEPLYYLAASLAKTPDKEQAAAFFHILQRVLADARFADDKRLDGFRKSCQSQLDVLDVDFRKQQAKYAATAAGKKFTKPEDVDDLWMTQVEADIHMLWGLYAWKLVGGRQDLPKDWIHNTQGTIHRSSGKLMDEAHGRKGLLYLVPNKKSHRQSRLTIRNTGKSEFLRIGARAYGISFVLNVVVDGKQVFSQTIGTKAWEDLKVPLGEYAGKDLMYTLELTVPEEQKGSEGAFFDYVDFFAN